ncbi:MAG: nucleoside deaminase [Rhodoglobus sp.]|nr:nucleoside deaminase [Rhodoglobus sp.]
MASSDNLYLTRAVELAEQARAAGNDPFGAVVVGADGTVVDAENTVVTAHDPTGHAELNVVRAAAAVMSRDQLATATLSTSTEPCAMCTGAIFWAGIPRVVFALAESELNAMLPASSAALVLSTTCREIFARGGRPTDVVGPVSIPGAAEVHAGYWG